MSASNKRKLKALREAKEELIRRAKKGIEVSWLLNDVNRKIDYYSKIGKK